VAVDTSNSLSDSFNFEHYCQSLPVWGSLEGVRRWHIDPMALVLTSANLLRRSFERWAGERRSSAVFRIRSQSLKGL
jgi:hypothetical protein